MHTPPPSPRDDLRFSNTTGILQKKTTWFIGVEVEQETSAPPPKKNPGSAPGVFAQGSNIIYTVYRPMKLAETHFPRECRLGTQVGG